MAQGPAPGAVIAVDLHGQAGRVASLAEGAPVLHLRLAEVDRATLARVAPRRVLAPLIAPGFDAVELAARLTALGYAGGLTVVCPPLPQPALVLRELRMAGPALRIDLAEPG